MVYQGQSQSAGIGGGRQSASPVTPRNLAGVDVCITTYDVLRRDLNHRPDDGAIEHALRRRKKYEVGASFSACKVSRMKRHNANDSVLSSSLLNLSALLWRPHQIEAGSMSFGEL